MRYRLDPLSPTGLSPVENKTIIRTGGGAVHTGAKFLNDLGDVNVSGGATDNQALAWDDATQKWIPQTISGGGGTTSPLTTKGDVYTFTTVEARLAVGTDGQVLTANSAEATGLEWTTIASAGSTTINNYSSLLAPQLFNPDAAGVIAGTDDFTLSSVSNVAFVTQNGQVLDDSEYSLVSSTLTVTPDNGFTDTADEILVFQYSYTLSSNGGATFNFVQKSSTYSIATSDYYIECTANTFTLTLPTAVGIGGQTFVIKNSGTGTITVDGTSAETIDGALTAVLSTQYEAITVASNGSDWVIT